MEFTGRHFPKDVILTTLRWYLRYKLSYRDIEELIAERGSGSDAPGAVMHQELGEHFVTV